MAARLNGGVAQLGEHLPCTQGVKSSNLSVSILIFYDRIINKILDFKFQILTGAYSSAG